MLTRKTHLTNNNYLLVVYMIEEKQKKQEEYSTCDLYTYLHMLSILLLMKQLLVGWLASNSSSSCLSYEVRFPSQC